MVSARSVDSLHLEEKLRTNHSLNHNFKAINQATLVASLFLCCLSSLGLKGGVANLKMSNQVTTCATNKRTGNKTLNLLYESK
jgi:hypothetical protein